MTRRPHTIAVIGAGPAGLACAQALRAGGHAPVVFEKSRGLGGRVATRRRDGLQFDHGAQLLYPARDGGPAAAALGGAGIAPWPAGVMEGAAPFVGVPRMKACLAPLSAGLNITYSSEVKSVFREGGAWVVQMPNRREEFDAVAFAATAPQILRALDPAETALRDALAQVRFAPCHALMVAFEGAAGWPVVMRDPTEPFAWIVNDSAKPGRSGEAECWVAHTTAEWSAQRLEAAPEEVAEELVAALDDVLGPLPPVRAAMGHRWRFAQTSRPLGEAFAASRDGLLLAGGDWALGARIEDAIASGTAMARALMERLAG